MASEANTQPVTIETCDHLKADPSLPGYDIIISLGDHRALRLCLLCGKAAQADILAMILERSLKTHVGQWLKRSMENKE